MGKNLEVTGNTDSVQAKREPHVPHKKTSVLENAGVDVRQPKIAAAVANLLRDGLDKISADDMFALQKAMCEPLGRDHVMAALRAGQADETQVREVIRMLIDAWVRVEPLAVLAWGNEPEIAPYLEEIEASVLAEADPLDDAASWAYAERLPGELQERAKVECLTRLARTDPDLGAQRLEQTRNSAAYARCLTQFNNVLAESNYSRWQDWLTTYDAATQEKLRHGAYAAWVQHDPVKATQWLSNLPEGAEKWQRVSELVVHSIAESPDTAMEWLETLPTGEVRTQAVGKAMAQIGQGDTAMLSRLMNLLGASAGEPTNQ